jgi:hypothetical protein
MKNINQIFKGIGMHLTLLAVCLAFGCSKEELNENTPATNPLIGNWEWYLTIEPYPLKIITPLTEGYVANIKFNIKDTVEYYKNEILINKFPFKLKYRINDHLNPDSDSTLVLVINNGTETFFSTLNDTLILDQTYVDGPRDYYSKKK